MTGASLSDCSMSYTGHSLGGESYPSEEIQPMYSTATAEILVVVVMIILIINRKTFRFTLLIFKNICIRVPVYFWEMIKVNQVILIFEKKNLYE